MTAAIVCGLLIIAMLAWALGLVAWVLWRFVFEE